MNSVALRAWLAFSVLLAGCATAPGSQHVAVVPPDAPGALKPAAVEEPFLQLHANGVQIYECVPPGAGHAGWAWQFKAPEATLTDASFGTIVHHFAGPSWASSDGATIIGRVIASVPALEAGSIPWLLLSVSAHNGTGLLAPTTSVQRLDTSGGAAPSWPCSTANPHQVERVGYSATYVFWRAKGSAGTSSS